MNDDLQERLADLEATADTTGEYADPPDLSAADKHRLNELFDVDVWEPNPETRAATEQLHSRWTPGENADTVEGGL